MPETPRSSTLTADDAIIVLRSLIADVRFDEERGCYGQRSHRFAEASEKVLDHVASLREENERLKANLAMCEGALGHKAAIDAEKSVSPTGEEHG
jgi:hypothetical protein